jgi:hypothetical protein
MTKIIEHNADTGEIIEREMTKEELAQQAKDIEAEEKRLANLQAQAAAKAALLERLGITEEEAKLLLG